MRWFRHVFGFLSIMLLSATIIASWVAGLVPFDFWTLPEVPPTTESGSRPQDFERHYEVEEREGRRHDFERRLDVKETGSLAEKETADIESEIRRVKLEIDQIRQSRLPEQEKKVQIRELKLDQNEKELKIREIKLKHRELAVQQPPQSLQSSDLDKTKKTNNNSVLTSLQTRIIALLSFFGLLSGAVQMIIYIISAVNGLSRVTVSKRSEL